MSTQISDARKIAIVTGGSRGIGRSIVLSLARNKVDSIFTYRSNRTEAEKVVSAVAEAGAAAVALPLDQTDTDQFEEFIRDVRAALRRFGQQRFDYLVNNAGTALQAPIDRTTEEQMDAMYKVHFKGVFFLTQRLLPLLNDGGRIVNVSSGLTRFTLPGTSVYAAMKGAVEVLTRYLAKELGSRRIAVNTVAPGAVETDFGGGFVRDNAEINRYVANTTALGRAGVPDDIGPMIASLLAPENHWVNAQLIEVSGGQSI